MCGPDRQSSTPPPTPPDPTGPIDDRFAYRVTEEGLKALAEYERANGKPAFTKARLSAATARALENEAYQERKRRRRKNIRDRGRRLFTVCGRWRRGRRIPDLRLTGQWLESAGFPLGQEIEVEVEAGRLTLRRI